MACSISRAPSDNAVPSISMAVLILWFGISSCSSFFSPSPSYLRKPVTSHRSGRFRYSSRPSVTLQVSNDNDLSSLPFTQPQHPEERLDETDSIPDGSISIDEETTTETTTTNKSKRRKMEISWCWPDVGCVTSDSIREKVIGDDNEMTFEGPATGQVNYRWLNDLPSSATPTVFLLVKRDDDELLSLAASTVTELISNGISVQLMPEFAAKLKHYFGVDDASIENRAKISLFQPKPFPGFGGTHMGPYYEDIPNSFMTENGDTEDVKNNPATHKYSPSPDLICTLGGDGLVMHASSLFPGPCPPVLCIAGGSLGFLTPFSRDEILPAIQKSLGLLQADGTDPSEECRPHADSNDRADPCVAPLTATDPMIELPATHYDGSPVCISLRMRLDCKLVNREGTVKARFNVLNEVVIDRGSSPYLAALECFCDNVHLTTVHADGIIFSTPTGSTAYSMSAGGSVVHPSVPAILVTPICPHVLSFRSMVFPDHVVLRCYVPDDARAGACVAFDGKFHRELNRGDSIVIQMSAHPVPTINRMDHSSDWLNSLKTNFQFNSRVKQKPL